MHQAVADQFLGQHEVRLPHLLTSACMPACPTRWPACLPACPTRWPASLPSCAHKRRPRHAFSPLAAPWRPSSHLFGFGITPAAPAPPPAAQPGPPSTMTPTTTCSAWCAAARPYGWWPQLPPPGSRRSRSLTSRPTTRPLTWRAQTCGASRGWPAPCRSCGASRWPPGMRCSYPRAGGTR